MDKRMDNEIETGVIKGLYTDPSIQMLISTLGPIEFATITYIGLFGFPGIHTESRLAKLHEVEQSPPSRTLAVSFVLESRGITMKSVQHLLCHSLPVATV